jgi:hypothetical protein
MDDMDKYNGADMSVAPAHSTSSVFPPAIGKRILSCRKTFRASGDNRLRALPYAARRLFSTPPLVPFCCASHYIKTAGLQDGLGKI